MALITLPQRFGFTSVDLTLQRFTNMLRSRFTGQSQLVSYPFAVWMLEGELVDMDGPEAAALRSFLVQLEGRKNTFKIPVPGNIGFSTEYAGDLYVINGAAARATSFQVQTITPITPNSTIAKTGDYFTVYNELKVLTSDLVTNGAGIAVANFQPFLRKAIAVAGDVPTARRLYHNKNAPDSTGLGAYCLMRALDDDIANWALKPPVRHSSKFKAIEALDD
jgi:hypothetical protein